MFRSEVKWADVRDDQSREVEKKLETPMIIAALLVIPSVIIDLNEFGPTWRAIGLFLNCVIWAAFLFEFIVMMRVVPDRRIWIETHKLETFLVVASFPVLPAGLGSLRLLRLLRVARLARLAKLGRQAFSLRGLPYVALLTVLLIIAAGSAFASVESHQHLSELDGLWWSITTVSTVGYGDISPQTEVGRFLAVFVMFIGIGFVAVLTAAVAQFFIRHELESHADDAATQERKEILSAIERLETKLEALARRVDSG